MRGRLLVVSHASVLPVNQHVYARLVELGWDAEIVVPSRWRHAYAPEAFEASALPALAERLVRVPVALSGRPQRHTHLASAAARIRRLRPETAFVEEELFSVAALQWSRALTRARVPFGVQAAENLDRALPLAARAIRRFVLRRADFVAARSPAAGALARRYGARGEVGLAPHAVPEWPDAPPARNGVFTVGFAGRLVAEKGVRELVRAAGRLGEGTRVLLVGDGPLRGELEGAGAQVLSGMAHDRMPEAFAQMDVLVLPSRSTPTWEEQFGRVLVEALACGVPVVGSDSGEIPWVVETTGGGVVVPEGDESALAGALATLRDDPTGRQRLADTGRAAVERLFGVDAAARALDDLLLGALERRNGNG
jgi:glycosyltransferase involved in cell wall biosynthesis